MKKILISAILFPSVAFAQGVNGPLGFTLEQVFAIVNQLIPVMLALAVLLFLWGIVKFIASAGDPAAKEAGVRHMVWGMIALFVMVGFWSIIGYVQESFGLQGEEVITIPAPRVDVTPGT